MTDRDHFAAAALAGLLASDQYDRLVTAADYADTAYEIADTMLRERERTNHDAAPEATAGTPGTGDTPKPINGCVSDRSKPIASEQEPVAWGVAAGGRVLATSISRIDAVDMQSEYECDTAIVPLYRHPPVTKPMPQEKQAEVSDRSKPITGPDPDSRVWETHTPATHATQGECSKPREGKEPVAWAAIRENGQPLWLSYDRSGAEAMVNGMAEVVPLYRQPPCQDSSQKNLTLTDAEREAIRTAADAYAVRGSADGRESVNAATLRCLLERLGGVE